MRILASTTAGSGHFEPLVPVLRACACAGHEIVVACPASFAGAVSSAGFAVEPFGEPPPERMGAAFGRVVGASYDEANEIVIREVFGTLDADAAVPRLSALVSERRPDVVLRDPSEFASWLVASAAGIPQARVSNTLLANEARWAPVPAAALSGVAAAHGLDVDLGAAGEALVAGPAIVAAPAGLDPPTGLDPSTIHRYAPGRSAAAPVPDEVPSGDDPLLYVTFGTVAAGLGLFPRLYRCVVDALSDLPVRVLVTIGRGSDVDALGPLPRTVRVAEFVAQDAVLTYADVMVTHGGFGTVLGGLRAGVPMVVTPMFADQPDNAARVAAAGAGIHVQPSEEPMHVGDDLGHSVRQAVVHLLGDPSAKVSAVRLADEMAAHSPLDDTLHSVLGNLAARAE